MEDVDDIDYYFRWFLADIASTRQASHQEFTPNKRFFVIQHLDTPAAFTAATTITPHILIEWTISVTPSHRPAYSQHKLTRHRMA
jgi:hypothetical protein